MAIDKTVNLVGILAGLDTSTTLFLESLRGDRLKVLLESQNELYTPPDHVVERVTKLYFDSPELPLLYCRSSLNRIALKTEEYECLAGGILPIGVVFHQFNDGASIKKKKITVSKVISPELALSLKVCFDLVYQKTYEYWIGDRHIGFIREFYNEESLGRI